MSSYIPPITQPEAFYKLHLRRFDPERDAAPYWETAEIPWVVTMTVIEALEWLWDQGRYVAFRANCREFTCGSCAMLINGRPGLACDTPLEDGMRLEPLRRYPVKKDLVVDTSPVREKWRELRLWPDQSSPVPRREEEPVRSVPKETLEGWHRAYARCIECYACLEACPASAADRSTFAGPMWMLQIARARAHPLDTGSRLDQAAQQGVGHCVSCYECEGVCPVAISPIGEIQRLRRAIVLDRLKAWGARLSLRHS